MQRQQTEPDLEAAIRRDVNRTMRQIVRSAINAGVLFAARLYRRPPTEPS